MTDETQTPPPLKKFVYPFQAASNNSETDSAATEVVDPQICYRALGNAEDGFYPIGANGQWHGGIHFGSQTGATLAQDAGIRCIADGEVIAYRIDGTYPKVAYVSCGEATYSTGFALVRHRLQLPPAPKTTESAPVEGTGSGAASTKESKEPSLIFYTLYMHLHHWKGYQDDAKKPRPAYWGDTVYEVAESATDADRGRNPHIPEGGIGLNLRDADGKTPLGFAPRGVKLKLGDQGNKAGYYAVIGIESGELVPAGLTGAYAFKKELTETPVDPTPDEVVVLDTPVAVKAGALMGHLGQYQRHVDTNPLGSSCSERPLVQLDVFSGDDVEGFIAKSRERAKLLDEKHKTLLLIEAGATLASPAKADQQIVANDGITLDTTSPKTGAWAKVRKGPMEVVGKDSLSGYDKATRTYGNGSVLSRILDADGNAIALDAYNALTDKSAYTRREVMVPTGDPVWVQRSMLDDRPLITGRTMDAWSRFPLQAGDTTGPRAAWPRVVPLKNLEMTAVEADGTRWWQVDVGTAEGSGRSGWAREKDQTKVTLCTPWDWPGFELVKADDTPPATFYANHVAKQPRTPKDEQGTLAAQGASAESAPLFQSLYDVIDVDGDKKLTATEIRKALKQPWLAQAISRLITRYDSEWAGPMTKWDALDSLIQEPRKADWMQEKKRIESLLWWDEVKGKNGFPSNNRVTHLHPAGLIGNFKLSAIDCLTYRIYAHDGSIKRITPSSIENSKLHKVRYIYIDDAEAKHELGEYDFLTTRRVLSGNVSTSGESRLVDLRDVRNYSSGQIKFGFQYDTRLTLRPYISDLALASLFGAMLDLGYEDISCNGFSDHLGHSIGGSKSHRNGENGDFKYLRLDNTTQSQSSLHIDVSPELMDEARQNSFNDSLYKYGWKDLRAWTYKIDGKSRNLNHAKHLVSHHHHLHVQGFSPDIDNADE
ncbi:hypothetical protein [Lysobacter sp. A03]|uniref:hypothetical protein n=1 Tax=Lysobacter sp. A03 TaxID=1199154 RepID=UPI0005B7120F|nr:hypothetical protein [Lysobacter sp. A03]KIQ96079.1 hypothetical protein TI01_2395 [Lysobacter sp. A03]